MSINKPKLKKSIYYALLGLTIIFFIYALFIAGYDGPEYEFTCAKECSYYCPCPIQVDSQPVACNSSSECDSPLACAKNMCSYMEEPFYYQYKWQTWLVFIITMFAFYKFRKFLPIYGGVTKRN